MAIFETTGARELLDLTDKVPPPLSDDSRPFEAVSSDEDEERIAIGTNPKLAAQPPPIPAAARARAATQPPPIPMAARAPRATLPPPIPAARGDGEATDFTITVEPAITIPKPAAVTAQPVSDEGPSAEWLSKIQSVIARDVVPPSLPAPRARGSLPPPFQMQPPAVVEAPAVVETPAVPAIDGVTVPRAPETLDDERPLADQIDALDATSAVTSPFEPPRSGRPLVAWTIGITVAAAGLIVGYVAMRGDRSAKPQRSAVATPAPRAPARVAAPAIAPAPVAAPSPSPVQVPITSTPAGATITLVADGQTSVVGRTPMTVSLDPARGYDVVVTLVDHGTRMEHLEPATAHALAFELPSTETARPVHHSAARVAVAPAPAARAVKPAAVPAGSGLLRVSAKPPCEIVIDGKVTHLVTPQRAVALAPGHHQVMLINAAQKIRKTFDVTIDARKPTTLIEDFQKKK